MYGEFRFPSVHDVQNHLWPRTRLSWNMSPEAMLGFRRVRRNCFIDGAVRECVSSRATPCENAQGRREEGDLEPLDIVEV